MHLARTLAFEASPRKAKVEYKQPARRSTMPSNDFDWREFIFANSDSAPPCRECRPSTSILHSRSVWSRAVMPCAHVLCSEANRANATSAPPPRLFLRALVRSFRRGDLYAVPGNDCRVQHDARSGAGRRCSSPAGNDRSGGSASHGVRRDRGVALGGYERISSPQHARARA